MNKNKSLVYSLTNDSSKSERKSQYLNYKFEIDSDLSNTENDDESTNGDSDYDDKKKLYRMKTTYPSGVAQASLFVNQECCVSFQTRRKDF